MANKFNGMAIVTVGEFKGSNARPATMTEGKYPSILQPVAGKIPSKSILSSVIADSLGLIPGKPYLVTFTEGDEDPQYGRQFNWVNAGPVLPLEILGFRKELGDGMRVDVLTQAEKDSALEMQMKYEEAQKLKQGNKENVS